MSTLVKTFRPTTFPGLLDNLLNEVDFFADNRLPLSAPAVNVKELDENFEIELAVPGLKKEDFKINIDEKSLVVSAEKQDENSETHQNYSRREFNFSSFKRTFKLPKTVDGEKIEATYADGILKLSLPKKEEAKPKEPRLIAVA